MSAGAPESLTRGAGAQGRCQRAVPPGHVLSGFADTTPWFCFPPTFVAPTLYFFKMIITFYLKVLEEE